MKCFLPGLGFPPNVSLTVKRILFVVALAILPVAGYVLAAHATDGASSCLPGTLADYVFSFGVTKGSCTIDGETFSNFRFDTDSVTSGSVRVTPVTTAGNPGFTFEGLWTQSTGSSSLFFDVSSTSGSPSIKDASVKADFSCSNCGVGSSITGATLSFDLGCSWTTIGSCKALPESGVIEANSLHNTPSSNSASFTPVALLGVDPLDFDARANDARLTSVTVQFSEVPVPVSVPEPSSIVLLGTGLVFGSGILRRRL